MPGRRAAVRGSRSRSPACAEARIISLARLTNTWVLHNPVATSAIIGPRTLEQLDDSLAAIDVEISAEEAARIYELVPPGTTVL